MLVNVCAEVIPGCKLNLALPRSSSSSLIRFLDVAAQWFQRAREELCADATLAARSNVSLSGPMPTAAVPQERSLPEAVTTSTFRVEEVAVFSPATSQWVAVTTGDQLYDGCQIYLFQPTSLAQSIGISDSVGLLPEPVGPEVFFRDCIDAPVAPSPPRRPSVLPAAAVRVPPVPQTVSSSPPPNRTATSSLARDDHRVAVRLSMERPGDDKDNEPGDGVTVTQFLVSDAPPPPPTLPRVGSAAVVEESQFRSRRPSPPRQPIRQAQPPAQSPNNPTSPELPRTHSSAATVVAPALDPYTVLDELFALLDTDRDGSISLSQLRNAMVFHGVDPDLVAPSFDHGDRTVSKSVFLHFVNRYYRVAVALLDKLRSYRNAQLSPQGHTQQHHQPSASSTRRSETVVGAPQADGTAASLRQQQLDDILGQEAELLLQLEALRKVKRLLLESDSDAGDGGVSKPLTLSPRNSRSPMRQRSIPNVKSAPPSASRQGLRE